MCLAVSGKMVEIFEKGRLHTAKVGLGGVAREICLDYVREAQVGQYCLIHMGIAIRILNEDESLETLDLLEQIVLLYEGIEETC